MALEAYRRKRDFAVTPEPRGAVSRTKGGAAYLIQKHAARRLHYDLRLELDGVLLSWAVTRGPSLAAGDRRLAVRTEDHPLDYADFEGVIPPGGYGAGAVILWDRGRWRAIGDPRKGLAKGALEFVIEGEKLGGRWRLTRMAQKPRERAENWLLIKGHDPFARAADAPPILQERPESVKTGRCVEALSAPAPPKRRREGLPAAAVKAGWPGFVEPALATLRPAAPKGPRWVHEIKFDGYRLQAHVRDGRVTLLTRSGLDWTDRFGPALTGALAALPARAALIDGEVIVTGPSGASDFAALQADLAGSRSDRIVFCAFDLLHLDGHDLRPAALLERKATLERLLRDPAPPLRFSEHFEEDGELVLRHACRLSLEGVVSKDGAAPYRSGRVKAWIKSKCAHRQEFVVAGFTPSSTARRAVGSLVLGHHDAGGLAYAGRVGTGFSQSAAADLFARLDARAQADDPFAEPLAAQEARGVTFVRPELVAEVEFRAWTTEGVLRHAAFRGLREDRRAADVTRESDAAAPDRPRAAVRLTHPDRLYWPDQGVTKQGLADFVSEVWPLMAPHVVNRPLSLLRCPTGVGAQCFFQKHAWRGMAAEILRAQDPADPGDAPILAVDGLPGLLGLVQGATLEIHPWGATLDDIERPDLITMDLDPGPGVAWTATVDAALEVRERLAAAGLASFVKTSGGKGLHVVAPLAPRAEWPEVRRFAKGVAEAMAADDPDRYVASVSKARRKGRILIDWLRNGRGATAVAPYSARARPGAAVSTPLDWSELGGGLGPDYFTVMNVATRLAAGDDPWRDFRAAARPLPTGAR